MRTSFVLIAMLLVGCSTDQIRKAEEVRQDIVTGIAQVDAIVAELKPAVEAMPAGQLRDKGLATIAKYELARAELQKQLAATDTLIAGLKADNATQVGSGVAAILTGVPWLGPFAGMIGTIAGIVWGLFQKKKKATAVADLVNVVNSIERAGPEWSEADKAAIAALQGGQTTATVKAIKEQLGLEG